MAGSDPLIVGSACERAREWSSLRLDDELSVLEEEILERHLSHCETCARFEEDMRTATVRLRTTPAEVPSRRVVLPARRAGLSRHGRRTATIAAAALALGALVGSLVERPGQSIPREAPPQVSWNLARDLKQLRDLPRTRFTTPVPTPAPPRNPPEGVI